MAESGDLGSCSICQTSFFFCGNLQHQEGRGHSQNNVCAGIWKLGPEHFSQISDFQNRVFYPSKTHRKCVEMIPDGICDISQPMNDLFYGLDVEIRPKLTPFGVRTNPPRGTHLLSKHVKRICVSIQKRVTPPKHTSTTS